MRHQLASPVISAILEVSLPLVDRGYDTASPLLRHSLLLPNLLHKFSEFVHAFVFKDFPCLHWNLIWSRSLCIFHFLPRSFHFYSCNIPCHFTVWYTITGNRSWVFFVQQGSKVRLSSFCDLFHLSQHLFLSTYHLFHLCQVLACFVSAFGYLEDFLHPLWCLQLAIQLIPSSLFAATTTLFASFFASLYFLCPLLQQTYPTTSWKLSFYSRCYALPRSTTKSFYLLVHFYQIFSLKYLLLPPSSFHCLLSIILALFLLWPSFLLLSLWISFWSLTPPASTIWSSSSLFLCLFFLFYLHLHKYQAMMCWCILSIDHLAVSHLLDIVPSTCQKVNLTSSLTTLVCN